jgi:site-specific DNA-methyltransferase (adenine-specific)
MARKKKVQVETPPSTAPKRWKAILAKHWQSHGGKWAAPQHYNCTYMAMFPPELPHYFIKRFTKLGDTVLDPFSGRGTTAVEASAQGRIGIGNDLNPLAVALSRGKISNPRLEPVLARLKELEAGYEAKKWKISKEPDKIKMIYHPNTLSQLCYLKANLDWSKQCVDAFLVSVLMGAMHGQSSGFLSVSMPNTFSMGWNYVKKYIKEKNLECPDRDVFEVLEKRVKRYLKKGYLVGSGKVIEGDVRDLDAKVEHDSVQLLFTSPPYLKVIKYGLYNWIRLWFLTESGSHEEVDAKLDDTHALNEYLEFMKDTLTATLPLLDRKRGLSCWAIGDVKGLNLAWAVWHHAGSKIEVKADDGTVLKYKLIAIVEDKIPDNQKVSKIWKTLAHHVEYVNETDEVVESVGQWETEKEAKAALKKAEEKEGLTLKIRVEKTNDKSGKATPTDRILIIAPESSKPKAFMKPQDLDWKPFHTTKSVTLDDFTP